MEAPACEEEIKVLSAGQRSEGNDARGRLSRLPNKRRSTRETTLWPRGQAEARERETFVTGLSLPNTETQEDRRKCFSVWQSCLFHFPKLEIYLVAEDNERLESEKMESFTRCLPRNSPAKPFLQRNRKRKGLGIP